MPSAGPHSELERNLREINEALLISAVRQHELAEQAGRTDAELRESHARFEALFDESPVAMYMVDSQLRLLLINRKARPAMGSPDQNLIGSSFEEMVKTLWPPAVAHEIISRFRHTLATGEPFTAAEFSELRHDNRVREYYDWKLHRISLPGGNHGVVCYFQDISARMRAEQSMRDSEVRYRRLFQSSKDGILILDAESGQIIDANAYMTAMLGQDLPQLLGKELYQIGVFGDQAASKAAFLSLQQNGYIRYDHLPVQKPDGETIQVEFVSNIYRENDRMLAQCNVRNISARMLLEQQVLLQAENLADQSRRKDEFLAMLSHELRNPLAPIRAAVHLLKLQERGSGSSVAPVQRQAREIIERQVGNLTKLVNDLMEVSRVVSGRVRLDLQNIDLNSVVQHALQTTSPLFQQNEQTLALKLCEECLWVHADPTRLEEVLINLLNNAAKYTPRGGHIEVMSEARAHLAVVRVKDNGMGMEKELLPHVFDLFTQADRSLSRSSGGLGIGLCLAQRLVELHSGTIHAASDGPGRGSEFTVLIPRIKPLASADGRDSRNQTESSEADGLANSHAAAVEATRVLVVDDNIDLVTMLSSSLRLQGYSVQTSYTGLDALQVARRQRPHIILLDIGLPDINGYELARRLRAQPETASAKLIALTGYGRETDVALARESGFDSHLTKPCDPDALLAVIAGFRKSSPS